VCVCVLLWYSRTSIWYCRFPFNETRVAIAAVIIAIIYNRVKEARLITFNRLFDYIGQNRDSITKSEHCLLAIMQAVVVCNLYIIRTDHYTSFFSTTRITIIVSTPLYLIILFTEAYIGKQYNDIYGKNFVFLYWYHRDDTRLASTS